MTTQKTSSFIFMIVCTGIALGVFALAPTASSAQEETQQPATEIRKAAEFGSSIIERRLEIQELKQRREDRIRTFITRQDSDGISPRSIAMGRIDGMASRLVNLYEKLDSTADRIETHLETLANQGVTSSKANRKLAQARAELHEGLEAIDIVEQTMLTLQTRLTDATTPELSHDEEQMLLDELRVSSTRARTMLKASRESLRNVLRELKGHKALLDIDAAPAPVQSQA